MKLDIINKKYYFPFLLFLLGTVFFSFLLTQSHALEFIVDNTDTSNCFVNPPIGSPYGWTTSTWGKPYGIDKLYTTKGDGSKTVTWRVNLPIGRFDVKAWVNTAPYASDAHYLIIHSGITTAITRNQNNTIGDWSIDLGTYDFNTMGEVVLTDYWVGPETYVVADAIKFVDVSTVQTMGISWNTSTPADAISLATTQEKPIMLYFSTDKSVDCQRMANETFNDPTLIKWSEKFIATQVKAETNPDALRAYNVYKVPTIIILDSTGKEKKRISGFISANDLVNELNTQLGMMGQ